MQSSSSIPKPSDLCTGLRKGFLRPVHFICQRRPHMLCAKYRDFLRWNIYQIYPRSFMDANGDGI